MKALIVDDEPLARRELRRLLSAHRSIQIVGEAGDIGEARECIESLTPGVVFLDIQMPGGSGFDLLAQLEWLPRIIFTTAYDCYAVTAFDVSALDYLLKPIEPERLAAALEKLHAKTPGAEGKPTGVPRWNNSSYATGSAAGLCHFTTSVSSAQKATTYGCSGDRNGLYWGARSRRSSASWIRGASFARTGSRSSI